MTLLTASATELRRHLLARKLSAVELLDATLRRIDAINPAINAVVAINREAARAAAEESDRRIASGEARALEGLPITIKDSFDVAGLPSTAGAPMFKDRIPSVDAAAIARLRAAGAVILGKSNVPAFTADFQTYNGIYGTTNNPWNPALSPGGSSGGAAAAVATGMSAFELGSDLGGSIRWPAHACGVFGLKTTWNLVSIWGHIPPMPERRMGRNADLVVAGPIARSAQDLELVLPVLAGPREDASARTPLPPVKFLTSTGPRVGLWIDDPFAPTQQALKEAVLQAASLLAKAGAEIVETAPPPLRIEEAFEVFSLLNHAIVAHSLPPKVRARLQAAASSFAPGDLSHRALQARGARMTPGLYQQVKARKQRLEAAWARYFERFDVLLCPAAPVVAIPHDHRPDVHARTLTIDGTPRPYMDFLVWASLATVADLPAVVAPVMRTAEGLPVGVQIIAARGEDLTAIAVADMLGNGCYEPPPV